MDPTKQEQMSLANLADGAAVEVFDRALLEVIANINDPNTDPKAKRKIILEVTFQPDDERFLTSIKIEPKLKLAAQKPVRTQCVVEADGQGAMAAREVMVQHSLLKDQKKPPVEESDKVRKFPVSEG